MISQSVDSNPKIQALNPHNPQKNYEVNVGKWTNQENLKYAIFMDFHKKTLSSRQKKKDFKFFQEMSKFIVSRNTVQCRSHHQKIQQRFKHFKKIISAVKNQMGRKQYKTQFKKWTNNGQSLVIQEPKLKENSDLSQVSTKKQSIKEQVHQVQIQGKGLQRAKTQDIYPLLGFNNFYNPFGFPFANILTFPSQYFS